MRARVLAAAAGAVTAGSLLLWPSAAGAGGTPDEQQQSTRFVTVNGVQCQVVLYAERYTNLVYASTEVVTTADACATQQTGETATFRTPSGDQASAGATHLGPKSSVSASGAADLVQTVHTVAWAAGGTDTFTLGSK